MSGDMFSGRIIFKCWLIHWFIDLLIYWFIDVSIYWFTDLLIYWLIDLLIYWFIDLFEFQKNDNRCTRLNTTSSTRTSCGSPFQTTWWPSTCPSTTVSLRKTSDVASPRLPSLHRRGRRNFVLGCCVLRCYPPDAVAFRQMWRRWGLLVWAGHPSPPICVCCVLFYFFVCWFVCLFVYLLVFLF